MSKIQEVVSGQHAVADVVYYCLYDYFYLGRKKSELSILYNKHISTISNWISKYKENGEYSRKNRIEVPKKFNDEKREWIVNLFTENPTLHLREAQQLFLKRFLHTISSSYVWQIIHDAGFTYKKMEQRAIQIRLSDVMRFFEEISRIQWDFSSLIFLDEVGFDHKDMIRNRGYVVKGAKIYHRGDFLRKTRSSLLCFLGQTGVKEVFWTEGTFNRLKFFDCCRKFALSGQVETFPGKHSVWILDGARIHCDPNIVYYLRSIGIIPIFLPAYSPFFNPIEIIFAYVKKSLQNHYKNSMDLNIFIATVLKQYKHFNSTKIFEKCGYRKNSTFDPSPYEM